MDMFSELIPLESSELDQRKSIELESGMEMSIQLIPLESSELDPRKSFELKSGMDMSTELIPLESSELDHRKSIELKSRMDVSTELIPLESSELDPRKSIELKPQGSKKHTFLSNEEKKLMFECLLKGLEKGKFKRGVIKSVADSFSVNTKTVTRFWEKTIAKATQANHGANENPYKGVGRKRIDIDPEKAAGIDFSTHTSLKSLAKELNMSSSTLHRRLKERGQSFPLKATPLNVVKIKAFSSSKEEGEIDRAVREAP